MDIEHTPQGPVEVILDQNDVLELEERHLCTTQGGIGGSESKTSVRFQDWTEEPVASIDGEGDLNVALPTGTELPVTIEHEAIHFGEDKKDRQTVEHYFGKLGNISIQEA
jgi:hypothetical protein